MINSIFYTKHNSAGFTLIELLVVISIIGVLSSTILVSLNTARDRANIAKSLYFSASINHSLEAVGAWEFNEGSGITTADSSGLGNNGTFVSSPVWVTDSPLGRGYALSFDGLDDYVNIGSNFNLLTGFTVEIWTKADSTTSLNYVFWRNDDRPGIRMSGNKWTFMVDGNLGNAFTSSVAINVGKWEHLAFTFNGSVSKAYVNGVSVGTRTDSTYTQGTIARIGSDGVAGRTFNGSIDSVRIYNQAIPSAQIQQHYAEGLNKIHAKGLILKEEHDSRSGNFGNQDLAVK